MGSVLTDWAKADTQARRGKDTCNVSAGGGADDNGGAGRAEGFSEQTPYAGYKAQRLLVSRQPCHGKRAGGAGA